MLAGKGQHAQAQGIWIRQLGDDGDTLSFDLVDGDLQVVNFIKFNRVHILFYIGSHLVS